MTTFELTQSRIERYKGLYARYEYMTYSKDSRLGERWHLFDSDGNIVHVLYEDDEEALREITDLSYCPMLIISLYLDMCEVFRREYMSRKK